MWGITGLDISKNRMKNWKEYWRHIFYCSNERSWGGKQSHSIIYSYIMASYRDNELSNKIFRAGAVGDTRFFGVPKIYSKDDGNHFIDNAQWL